MSLFQIELVSKKLQNVLKIPASTKYKILSIINFFKLIFKEPEQSIYHSYYEEFLPSLLTLIGKLGQTDRDVYFSPEEFDEIENVLIRTKDIVTLDSRAYDIERINNILKEEKTIALSYLDREAPGVEGYSTDSINIVLIEKNLNANSDSGLEAGIIHRFNLSSSRRSRSETVDKIEFSNLVDIDKTRIVKQLNQVTTIAKSACLKQDIKTHYYNFTYFFDLKEYIYTGSSLGLGGVALAYNSILINELCKHYFKFRNDTVFTAEIDKEGNLVKLDEKSLELKLRAVFFSPYKKIVIPEENIKEAKSELETLNKKYTKRELQLIPIRSFENVFKNLDLVERCELKFKDKVIANYRRYHTAVNWVLSIMTLCVIVFFIINYLIPHLDRNPVTINYEQNRFIAYNKFKKQVWESKPLDKSYSSILGNDIKILNYKCVISDLENDETNEILYLIRSDSNHFLNRTFYCINSDNKVKWEYTTPEQKIYYNNTQYEDNFFNFGLYVCDFDKDGFKETIRTGQLGYMFPFLVSKFNYKGELISEYWNSGYLLHVVVYDIEGDGKFEIITGGCNNKFRQAALVVFDPNFISGSSPLTNPKKDNQRGLEKYYILFPRSIINYHAGKDLNNVGEITQYKNNKLIVTVSEGWVGEKKQDAFVIYKFDKDMKIISAELSSPFTGNYEELVSRKIISPIKDLKQYADSLKNAVRYWDGENFASYPVMNRNYLTTRE